MFQVNTCRWDYAQVAALVAPRPLLILLNTDDDSIFPLDGVVRVYNQVRRIYELHDAKSKLGLVITPCGHQDTREIRLPAFNWFNQYLKDEKKPIKMFAHTFFEPELTVSGFQFLVQALSELYIFTGIGDEYIGHIICPLSFKL